MGDHPASAHYATVTMGDLPAGAYYAVHLASAIFTAVSGRISRAVKFLLDALEP